MPQSLDKAIQESVLESQKGAKAIAIAIAIAVGKSYSTLMREINPCDTGAKLGVGTFMGIIKTTGDVRPLELLAAELGYRLISVEEATS